MKKVKKVKKVSKKEVVKKYHLIMKFNGQVHDLYTDNLEESIMSLKPLYLKTFMTIRVEENGKVCDRVVLLKKGRMLFKRPSWLKVFLQKLSFK